PTVEAELISTLFGFLTGLGLKNLCVHINSIGCPECRPKYHQKLKEYLGERLSQMCPTCQERFAKNPLRILDCKEEKCKAIVKDAPSILDCLCEDCGSHFEKLQTLLTAANIPFALDPRIVRGLDYYTKTGFEIIMQSGREGLALCGGGRYDKLVEELGGPATPAAGFGIGIERILIELTNQGLLPEAPGITDVYVANLGADMAVPAFTFTQALREKGVKADCDVCGRSLKAQFKFADKVNAKYVAIMGGDEYARSTVKIRNMQTREEVEFSLDTAAEETANLLK
ncbi:MAG: histidine--tRNA ligase, partial [Clostridia bacterium]|nr:histidine--tRNA ligase [Clostridia bacterium]